VKRTELQRRTPLRRGPSSLRRTPLGHCTSAQKERVRDRACIVCAEHRGDCHPAHVIDRAVVSVEVANDVRAVVPLCSGCHREYDTDSLDLSPYLEPSWRDSAAWAVEAVGMFRALRRITGQRWAPVESEAA
jgi:hypothetical protein